MPVKINEIGNRYGRLLVLEEFPDRKDGKVQWICKCNCGNIKIATGKDLRNGKVKSCGCLISDILLERNYKHGHCNERLYEIWKDMKRRCNNSHNWAYKYYGGKGIYVCKEWEDDYIIFRNWAINNGYKDDLTIDRIDSNGNYEPNNCRWADMKTQCNNKTNNHYIEHNGKILTVSQWEDEFNICRGAYSDFCRNHSSDDEFFEYYENPNRPDLTIKYYTVDDITLSKTGWEKYLKLSNSTIQQCKNRHQNLTYEQIIKKYINKNKIIKGDKIKEYEKH